MVEQKTRPPARVDFNKLASDYNLMEVGRTLKIPRVSNVTNIKEALGRRGIESEADYDARNRGKFFYLRKLSGKPMEFKG